MVHSLDVSAGGAQAPDEDLPRGKGGHIDVLQGTGVAPALIALLWQAVQED